LFKVKMAKRRMTGEDVLKEIFNDKDSDEDDLELDLGVDELEVIDGDECNSEQSDVDAEIDDERPAVSDHCAASSAILATDNSETETEEDEHAHKAKQRKGEQNTATLWSWSKCSEPRSHFQPKQIAFMLVAVRTESGGIVETTWVCTTCPSTPGLCVEKGCFELYHTKLDYTAG
jgi:hypothetical protein